MVRARQVGIVALLLIGLGWGGALSAAEPVRVAFYNLHNYFVPAAEDGKSAASMAAVHRQLVAMSADVLIVAECGGEASIAHLRAALADEGLDYPFVTSCVGADRHRRLALFAKMQPTAILHNTTAGYSLKGGQHRVQRGFLHCNFDVDGYSLDVVGAHLKSKVFHELGQTDMRRYEARELRYLVNDVLKARPDANVLVMGDMNDDPNSSPILTIVNNRFNEDRRLWDLRPVDRSGASWTHLWDANDNYSRIDYAFASYGLLPEINWSGVEIVADAQWQLASDHRPVLVTLVPDDRDDPKRTASFHKSIRRPPPPDVDTPVFGTRKPRRNE